VPAVAALPVTVSAALRPEFNEVMSQAIVSVLVFEQPVSANGGIDGPLANVTASGSLTFDTSIIPDWGGVVIGAALLSGLAFTWDGISYDQAVATNTGALEFDSNGVLDGVNFGTACSPFGWCMVDPTRNDWIVSGFTPVGAMTFAEFIYTLSDGGTYRGFVNLSPEAAAVTEPSTWMLLLGSGLPVLLGRRRKSGSLRAC
jgi:hypothetical protein